MEGFFEAMGYGYQKRDYEIIDYQLWQMEGFKRPCRGPKPLRLNLGKFFACIGGAQTFGCYVEKPYPSLLSKCLDADSFNMGNAGAGPAFYLKQR